MEYYNNILCVSGSEIICKEDNPLGFISKSNYDKLKKKKTIRVIRRGCYGTTALIAWSSLPQKYKDMYVERYGDPEKGAKIEPFVSRIKRDIEAYNFYVGLGSEGDGLKKEKVEQYCNDVAILNALKEELDMMTQARAKHGERVVGFWAKAVKLVESARRVYEPCGLPKTAVTLRRKYNKYVEQGYDALVHAGHGNKNSATVRDDVSEAMLKELLSHGNQLSGSQVAETYNFWAKSNDERVITERTVMNYLKRNEYEIMLPRKGNGVWRDKYDQVVTRKRPSAPLLLINSDDNDLDLYFDAKYEDKIEGEVVTITNHFFRFKVYVVLDAYCDYILGYAVGNQITEKLVYEAFRNASRHVKELTGSRYMWQQIVADRWNIKKLEPFYAKQATFTPTAPGNARGKVIERSFGTSWHRELKRFSNYAGHNITAKTRSNADYIQKNMKNRPTYAEGRMQIDIFINNMRNIEWKKTGMSRQAFWQKGMEQAKAQEKVISDEVYMSLFGEKHEYQNKITNRGLDVTIGGEKIGFEVPPQIYRKAIGKKVQVTYDPEDLSQVLVSSEDSKLTFLAKQRVDMPMALADMQPGDRTRLNVILNEKRDRLKAIKQERDDRKNTLEKKNIDPQGYLQSGQLVKETYMEAISSASQTKYTNATQIDISKLI